MLVPFEPAMEGNKARGIPPTSDEAITQPEVVQQLLATTTCMMLDRERLATQLCIVLLSVAFANSTEKPNKKMSHEKATKPDGDKAQWHDSICSSTNRTLLHRTNNYSQKAPVHVPTFMRYQDNCIPQEFG